MLNSKKAYTYFDNTFGLKKSTNNWHVFHCPYCGKSEMKAAVHFDFETVKCWSCKYKTFLISWVAEYEKITIPEAYTLIRGMSESDIKMSSLSNLVVSAPVDVTVSLPVGFRTLSDTTGVLGMRAVQYLEGRNLDIDYLKKKSIGYCMEHAANKDEDYFGYIVLPFKSGGRLQYYIGRDYTGNWLRYKNPPFEKCGVGKSELMYNIDCFNHYDAAMLVEGSFCALTMGEGCAASLGKDLSPHQVSAIIRSSCSAVYIAYDVGAMKDAMSAASTLIDHKKVYVLDLSLIGDKEVKKDPNAIGKKEVLYLAKHTPQLTKYEILKSYWA